MNTCVWTVLIIIHAFVTCIYLFMYNYQHLGITLWLQSYHITYAFVPLTVICKATISRICKLFSVLFLTSYNNHTFTRPTKDCFSGSPWGFEKQSAISCNVKDCDENVTAPQFKSSSNTGKTRMDQFKRYGRQNNPKSVRLGNLTTPNRTNLHSTQQIIAERLQFIRKKNRNRNLITWIDKQQQQQQLNKIGEHRLNG